MFREKWQARNRLIYTLCTSLLWSVLTHGMALFNKYSYHDDADAFNYIGANYSSGRWMLALMGDCARKLTGGRHYSLPLVKGTVTLLCIALMLYLLYEMLDLKDPVICFLTTGFFIAFPAVTGIFGYMFTAPYYYCGALTGVAGIWLYDRKKTLLSLPVCLLMVSCSIGVYQANLPICVCTLLLLLIRDTRRLESGRKELLKKIIIAGVICIGSLAVYFILNRLFLNLKGMELSDYKGISNFGMTSIAGYLSRLVTAYRIFFFPVLSHWGNMFPFSSRYFHTGLVFIFLVLAAFILVSVFRKNKVRAIIMGLLIVMFPIAAYLIYVMVAFPEVHGLMTYGEVFTFLLAAWIYENSGAGSKIVFVIKKTSVLGMVILLFLFIRFGNLCYMKAEVLQSQAVNYFTALSSRIIAADGYTSETPVVYINEYEKKEPQYSDAAYWFDKITLMPYSFNSIINNYTWKKTMAFWCGFRPVQEEAGPFEEMSVVLQMPSYPDDGSVRYIDGCIVVKF